MDPTYVRSKMQSICNPLGKTGVERLQLLLKDISPKEDTVTQRKQQPKRKKATTPATVSPNKSSSPSQPSSDYPVPKNNQHFLIVEAVQAFKDYPNKKQKLLSYWEQQKFVPKYSTGRRHWNKMCLKMKDGTPLREWQFDDQGNFTFKKRQGRPSIVPTDQVKTFFEEAIPLGENVNSSHVKDMIASATKANDEAKGLYHNSSAIVCSKKTINNYKSVMMGFGDSATTNSVSKTEVRQTAECSIRSTVSFIMMTAVTMYSLGELQPGRPSLKDATAGAKEFEKLVSMANNNVAVCPLYYNNIHSTDDSAVYFVSDIND